jgi:predicted DNA-binding protein (MmcQ/YjbR family)
MQSRYFGRGGLEIVSESDQLSKEELEDLIRLSYNLTKDLQK